jgi:protein TonB
MAPIVKDAEKSVAASNPATAVTSVPKPSQDAPARPQPVPLEVPVSVNGARTIEGSDKREPFSESTKTVLVFGNGAVIRLASNVTPGQLLFVTNEKTKKEVVCQVVKSKNYRTVTGYVELEFTEPAAGFWGVRIPTDPTPVSAVPKAPGAPRPAVPVATVPPAIVPPKVAAPAPPPPALAATSTNVPVVSQPKTVIAPPPADSVTPEVIPQLEAAKPPVVAVPPPAPQGAQSVQEFLSAKLSAEIAALPGLESVLASTPPTPPVAKQSDPTQPSDDFSAEQLRQQSTSAQEKLSSLLFRETVPVKKATPIIPTPVVFVKQSIPDSINALFPEGMVKHAPNTKSESAAEPEEHSSSRPPFTEFKTKSAVSKTPADSLSVEEVKIPSWLAPLTHETEIAKEHSDFSPANAPSLAEDSSALGLEEKTSLEVAGESSERAHTVVFGGQLLGGSEANEAQTASKSSGKGLVYALAAAVLFTAAGVGWYGVQPGNFLASKPTAPHAVQNSSLGVEEAVAKKDPGVTAPVAAPSPTTAPSSPANSATTSRPAANPPVSAQPVENARNSNSPSTTEAAKLSNSGAATTAAKEVTPKKPVLGDVRLATPNVSRKENSSSTESAPSIEGVDATTTEDPLAGLTGNHNKQPAAPLPIGGDVKPARLLKSVPPVYPQAARSQRLAGNVQLDAFIDTSGNVSATRVISGPTLLHEAAVTAVKQWKYEPAQLDGKPTSMHLTVTVQFRLQ